MGIGPGCLPLILFGDLGSFNFANIFWNVFYKNIFLSFMGELDLLFLVILIVLQTD
jgi:hypothetical protein